MTNHSAPGAQAGMQAAEGTARRAREWAMQRGTLESCPVTAPAPARVLAADHVGMRVDYTGLLGQARSALKRGENAPAMAEMLGQLAVHLTELGQRWYAGDTAVVDEFLQLYCIESDARAALSAQPGAQKKESRVGTNTGHGHAWRRPDGYLARCGGPAICRQCAQDQAQTRPNNKDGGAVYG